MVVMEPSGYLSSSTVAFCIAIHQGRNAYIITITTYLITFTDLSRLQFVSPSVSQLELADLLRPGLPREEVAHGTHLPSR
jgi:hypothetical protein